MQNIAGLADAAAAWPARKLAHLIRSYTGGGTATDRGFDITRQTELPSLPKLKDLPRAGEALLEALEATTGTLYEPRTTAGKFARSAAEFVPGAGRRDLLVPTPSAPPAAAERGFSFPGYAAIQANRSASSQAQSAPSAAANTPDRRARSASTTGPSTATGRQRADSPGTTKSGLCRA